MSLSSRLHLGNVPWCEAKLRWLRLYRTCLIFADMLKVIVPLALRFGRKLGQVESDWQVIFSGFIDLNGEN